MTPAVVLDRVSKRFWPSERYRAGLKSLVVNPRLLRGGGGGFLAVDRVSLAVRPGETLGIVGRNGAGKSTVLGLIGGVLRPSAGTVSVRGRVFPLLELGVGFTPELTGRENVIVNGVLVGMRRREIEGLMERIVGFSGLHAFIDRPLKTYSSGMQARLGFAIAIHSRADVLLVDEVLAVGDAEFQGRCLERIAGLRRAGVTIVFVSHDLGTVEAICDRVAWLDAGRAVAVGRPGDVIGRYLAGRLPAPDARGGHAGPAALPGEGAGTSAADDRHGRPSPARPVRASAPRGPPAMTSGPSDRYGSMRIAARCLYTQRERLAAVASRLVELRRAVGCPGDLSAGQWGHWYALALEFGPDLVIELGRGRGNSTCVVTEAAGRIGGCRVASFCRTSAWHEETVPGLRRIVPPAWFEPLDAVVGDLVHVDFGVYVRSARRVLVVWDAHGLPVADCVLSRLMPLLATRTHLVIMHDATDTRYGPVPRDYGGLAFWRGQEGSHAGRTAPLNIGWLCFHVDQFIPVMDFAHRNGVELHSADHEVHTELLSRGDLAAAVREAIPHGLFSPVNHWVYFTLDEAAGPFTFPAFLGASFEGAPREPGTVERGGKGVRRRWRLNVLSTRAR